MFFFSFLHLSELKNCVKLHCTKWAKNEVKMSCEFLWNMKWVTHFFHNEVWSEINPKFVSGQWSVHYYILYSFINHLRVQHGHKGFYWFLKYFHPSFYAARHRHLCSNSPMHLRISTPLICACSKTKSNKHKKQPSVTFKKYWKTYVNHMHLNKIEYRCKHIHTHSRPGN